MQEDGKKNNGSNNAKSDSPSAERFYRCKPEALKKETFGTRLPKWMIDWLRGQDESQSTLIEAALISHYKLKPPQVVKVKRTISQLPAMLNKKT